MKVTSVRLIRSDSADQMRGLLAYASIVLDDCLVIHDAKLLNNSAKRADGLFVSFPTHPKMTRCGGCGRKGALKDRCCLHCRQPFPQPEDARKLHMDVCHPITGECREMIEAAVIDEWRSLNGETHRDEIPDEVFGEGVELDA